MALCGNVDAKVSEQADGSQARIELSGPFEAIDHHEVMKRMGLRAGCNIQKGERDILSFLSEEKNDEKRDRIFDLVDTPAPKTVCIDGVESYIGMKRPLDCANREFDGEETLFDSWLSMFAGVPSDLKVHLTEACGFPCSRTRFCMHTMIAFP